MLVTDGDQGVSAQVRGHIYCVCVVVFGWVLHKRVITKLIRKIFHFFTRKNPLKPNTQPKTSPSQHQVAGRKCDGDGQGVFVVLLGVRTAGCDRELCTDASGTPPRRV